MNTNPPKATKEKKKMIDFHSHILPNVDDGSKSIEESIELLKQTKQQGIKHIVATSHFYAADESPKDFIKRRNRSFKKLMKAIDGMQLPVVIPGAEVGYFEGMSDCEDLELLKIYGTPLLLVEMPVCSWSERMLYELEAIYEKTGLIPLIAHADRYISMLQDKKLIKHLSGLPVLIQVNSGFFINKKTRRFALSLLRKEQIHFIGSDCHNTSLRTQKIGEAIEIINKSSGNKYLRRISHIEKLAFKGSAEDLENYFI